MAKKRSTIIDIHRAKKAKSSRFLIAAVFVFWRLDI